MPRSTSAAPNSSGRGPGVARQGQRLGRPVQRLGPGAGQEPVPAEGGGQPQGDGRLPAVDGPAQAGVQVVALGGQPGQPAQLVPAAQVGLGLLGQLQEAAGGGPGQRLVLTGRPAPLGAVGPDRLQHPVADPAAVALGRHHQRLVDQPGQQVQHLVDGQAAGDGAGADPLHGLQGGPAGEHRQPPQQDLLVAAQQFPAPVDHGPQRLVAARDRPAAVGQEPERSSRRAATCPGERAWNRAAASSMASGRPSRARQIRSTGPGWPRPR